VDLAARDPVVCPQPGLRPHHPDLHLRPQNPTTPIVSLEAITLEVEDTLVATATMPTPISVAKKVTVIPVDSQDTSLGIALLRSQHHRASTCRSPPRAKAVDPHKEIIRTKPTLPKVA
jgi:hypothetical protein